MSYSTGGSGAASRVVLYILLLLAVLIWIVFGGAVFLGILKDVAA